MTDLSSSQCDADLIIDTKLKSNCSEYNNGMFFSDNRRRIDFVLVYHRINDSKQNEIKRQSFIRSLIKDGLEIEIQNDNGFILPLHSDDQIVKDHCDNFHEDDCKHSSLVFIKIYASWDTLCRYAEIMKIRKPMLNLGVDYNFNRKTFFQRIFEKFDLLKVFNIDESKLQPLTRGFTWPFSKSKEYLFDIPQDQIKFFSPAERSLIVNYILRRASYRNISDKSSADATDIDALEDIISKRNEIEMNTINEAENNIECSLIDKCEPVNEPENGKVSKSMDFGIAKLISDGVFESAYILHEKPLNEVSDNVNIEDNQRNLLYKNWVLMRNIFRLQPLDHIRLYFGEKVAFYFAWLGYYTYWLLPVSILGVVITAYNIAFAPSDPVLNEIYQGKNITMCPLMCSVRRCKFWKLGDASKRYFVIRMLDNGSTVILAIVMSIWASLFLEMWKRQQSKLAYHWNVHDMEYEDEPPRPEFVALIDKKYPRKINLISGKEEPFIPFWRQRVPVMFFSYSTVLLSIVLAIAFLGGVILYKLITQPLLMDINNVSLNVSSIITAATGSMISLIIIMILTLVYSRVAVWLTDLEHHRTQSQYDSSVTLKLYLLEFINNYSSIFYIGFVQQHTQPMPSYGVKGILKPKGCPAGGCLLDLSMQLAFIMIGKQIISSMKEYSIPQLCSKLKKYKLTKLKTKLNSQRKSDVQEQIGDEATDEVIIKNPNDTNDDKSENQLMDLHKVEPELVRCYADNILLDPGPRPLFGEYLEMLIQFGFITIFIPAFPLAPLLALINNLLEIRSDAFKFVRALRRPVAQRVKDIGIWINILAIVAQLAVKSNAFLISFTTTYIERFIFKMAYSSDGSLNGFMEFSMSYMPSANFNSTKRHTNDTYCRYMGFQYPPWEKVYTVYSYTPVFWQILAAKLAFIYLFENLVNLFMTIISVVIPDVPDKLRISMKREAVLTNEIILKAELLRHKNQNASKLVAESFKSNAIISQRRRQKHKPIALSLASRILMKQTSSAEEIV